MGENFKLCLGCMEPKTVDGVCPNCGYSSNTPYLPSYIAPGTILNERYLIGKLLRYNGESATYIAYDSVTNRKILMKEYMPDTLCSRVKGSSIISVNQKNLVQYKTFMSEFTELNKTLAKMRTLNHINPALELFAENNTTYVVFDYIEGITLKEYLQENAGELSWEEVKRLFPPIFTTLSLVHNAGIVHRGISPDTIWYTNKGELKLTDFCITASRTANTELAPEIFSGYAAPEQYSSSNWQGTWTDVYAISAVLYRILTGCMPIEAISRIGNDNLSEPALLNPNVPSNVSKVIMSGLKLSGDMRIQTVTELVTKLFEQPDYLDQGMNRTSTATIPKQQINKNLQQNVYKPSSTIKEKKKKEKVQNIKVALTIFLILLVVLGIAAIFAIFYFSDDAAEDNADSGTSLSDTTLETESEETTTTEEITTTTTATDVLKNYQMPSLIGKNYDAIKNSDSYKGFITFSPQYDFNDEYEAGIIYEQSIPEKELIAKGTTIEIMVSKGPETVAVPDFHGYKEAEYTEILNDMGIKYTIEYETDTGMMKEYVFNLNKQPGENINVAKGEILTVYISADDYGD